MATSTYIKAPIWSDLKQATLGKGNAGKYT